jgi:hypothetical protein
MYSSRAHKTSDADRGHRVLYVLTASLALAVTGLIAVAAGAQLFQ